MKLRETMLPQEHGVQAAKANGKRAQAGPRVSLKTSLLALAFLSTVPIAIAAAWIVYHFTERDYVRAESDLERRTTLLLNAVELRVQNVTEDLLVLAEAPSLRQGKMDEFAAHIVEANRVIGGFGIVLVDRTGQLILSTRRQGRGAASEARLPRNAGTRVYHWGAPNFRSDFLCVFGGGDHLS